jgi:putative membrane protein insertion efficiency factor
MEARCLAVSVLRAYRFVITPLKAMLGLNGVCRFTPTCSCYAEEAIRIHGVIRGSQLMGKRLLRCHPWGGQGHDPVPDATLR